MNGQWLCVLVEFYQVKRRTSNKKKSFHERISSRRCQRSRFILCFALCRFDYESWSSNGHVRCASSRNPHARFSGKLWRWSLRFASPWHLYQTVSVDAVVYFRIFNPIISVTNVENSRYSTQLLAATTLRNILYVRGSSSNRFELFFIFSYRGTKTLQEILSDRENISHSMQAHLDEGTDPWGVKVERVEM